MRPRLPTSTTGRPPRGQPPRAAGFSLIEVLVAFFIFALVIGSALQLVGSSLDLAARARDSGEARLIAESVLARVGGDIPLRPGRYEGQADGGYTWQVTAEARPFQGGGAEPEIEALAVRVRVSWGTAGRHVELQTLVPVPYVAPDTRS